MLLKSFWVVLHEAGGSSRQGKGAGRKVSFCKRREPLGGQGGTEAVLKHVVVHHVAQWRPQTEIPDTVLLFRADRTDSRQALGVEWDVR